MNAKTYLQQASYIRQRIARLEEQIEEIQTSIEAAGSIRYDKSKAQTSLDSDSILRGIVKLEEARQKRVDLLQRFHETYNEISERIDGLVSPLHRKILFLRYLEDVSFQEIAAELGYSFDYVRKSHAKAIREFGAMYNQRG